MSDNKLASEWKRTVAVYRAAVDSWNDAARQTFERNHWASIEGSMSSLLKLIDAAESLAHDAKRLSPGGGSR